MSEPTTELPRCNCGWGGVHDPDNPRCDQNQARRTTERMAWLQQVRADLRVVVDRPSTFDAVEASQRIRDSHAPALLKAVEAIEALEIDPSSWPRGTDRENVYMGYEQALEDVHEAIDKARGQE